MKNLFLAVTFIFMGFAAHAETTTVPYVDLDRYLGTWYEIASIPQPYTAGCFCTRANYSLKDNGDIRVDNTCRKNAIDGPRDEAIGSAYVKDKVTNSKLSVTFFWPFYGDYWIIALDSDYRYAVVSNSEGSDLWILSRTPELAPELLRDALQLSVDNGIDTTKLHTTTQKGCVY